MQTNIYSVFDSKAQTFCRPFFSNNDQTAMRDFASAANDHNLDIGRHPTDFTLFRLGSFQDVTGLITIEATPVSLGLASSFVTIPFEG